MSECPRKWFCCAASILGPRWYALRSPMSHIFPLRRSHPHDIFLSNMTTVNSVYTPSLVFSTVPPRRPTLPTHTHTHSSSLFSFLPRALHITVIPLPQTAAFAQQDAQIHPPTHILPPPCYSSSARSLNWCSSPSSHGPYTSSALPFPSSLQPCPLSSNLPVILPIPLLALYVLCVMYITPHVAFLRLLAGGQDPKKYLPANIPEIPSSHNALIW